MNFQCKSCGGNVIYSPAKKRMFCPFCDGEDTEEVKGDDSLIVCASCGGELTINELTSSSRCPYCNNYIVFDKRVSGEYKPEFIMPFIVSKEEAVEAMQKEFKKRTFAPISFLHEKTLVGMNGFYVPFFLYDYDVSAKLYGTAKKVKHWSSGNYDYTETSIYRIEREFEAVYDNIPADASYAMDDKTMDLLEPFDYKKMKKFDPKFMSGFFGEVYNDKPESFEVRAKSKVSESADSILNESVTGYTSFSREFQNIEARHNRTDYALLPVWVYEYHFAGRTYKFFVNGQSGKVIGKTPVSLMKVLLYGISFAGMLGLNAWVILSVMASFGII